MYIWTLILDNEKSIPSLLLDASKALLSSDEIDRAMRFIHLTDQNRFILAHAFCRLMLSHFGSKRAKDWCFDKEEKGRPFISTEMNQDSIDFNITHTKNAIACALSYKHRISVDMEAKNRKVNLDLLIARQFSALEQSQFESLSEFEQSRLFIKIWTLKEAYIKVTGRGLSEPLQSFGFDISSSEPICYLEKINDGDVSLTRLSGYQFGLADIGETHQLAWSVDCTKISEVDGPHFQPPMMTQYQLEDLQGLLNC